MDAQKAKEKLDDLEETISEGVAEVEFQGKKTKFRTLDEMRRISNDLQKKANSSDGGIRTTVAVFEKF